MVSKTESYWQAKASKQRRELSALRNEALALRTKRALLTMDVTKIRLAIDNAMDVLEGTLLEYEIYAGQTDVEYAMQGVVKAKHYLIEARGGRGGR